MNSEKLKLENKAADRWQKCLD